VIPAPGPVALRRAQALLAGVFLAFAAWTVPPMLVDIWLRPHANDFRLYYTAGQLGLHYGWSHLYDLGLQSRLLADLGFQPYLNPPLMAWVALPFSFLPFVTAHLLWTLLLLAALAGAWWLLKPEGQKPRIFWLLGFLALFPAAFSIGIGQPHALIVLAMALSVRLHQRGNEGWAGAILAVVWLKPQLAFLLPLGLLAARQWRMLFGLGIAGGLLGLLQLAAVGPVGLAQYLQALQLATTWDLQRRLSLAGVVPGQVFSVLRVVVVGLLLLASAGDRRRDHALVAVPLASLLVTPYSGFQDLAILAGAAWIWLCQSPDWGVRAWLLVGWVAAEFTLVWGPYPVVGYELAWMLVLALLGARRLGWLPGVTGRPGVLAAGREAPLPEPRQPTPAAPDRFALP
jgi:Glycosyltransferase family 87